MQIFQSASLLSAYLHHPHQQKHQIGFVPTMGALHAGHLSLLQEAKKKSNKTVVSIFINPTQFTDAKDFLHYPQHTHRDIEALLQAEVDVLFLPQASEIYPQNYRAKKYELGNIEHIFEGEIRPQHFQGVCQVLDILFSLIQPHEVFMGQKDAQQCLVVKRLIKSQNFSMRLHICEIYREENGLAMSSRNERLDTIDRQRAGILYECLKDLAENKKHFDEKKQQWIAYFQKENISVDYLSLVDAHSLEKPTITTEKKIILIAARLGGVRLIDNIECK